MKKILVIFFVIVNFLVPSWSQVSEPKMVQEIIVDSGPVSLYSLVINNGACLTVTEKFDSVNVSTYFHGFKLWQDNLSILNGYMNFNNAIDVSPNNFLVAIKDTVYRLDQIGRIISKFEPPVSMTAAFSIYKNCNGYYIIGVNSTLGQSVAVIYNNDLEFIRTFPIGGGVEKASIDSLGNLYVATTKQIGGTHYNTAADIAKYDHNGIEKWRKHFPDQLQSQVVVSKNGDAVYYAAVQLQITDPLSFWQTKKFDSDGNLVWSQNWVGSYPDTILLTHGTYDMVALPTDGCIVVGATTKPGQNPSSPNYNNNLLSPTAVIFTTDKPPLDFYEIPGNTGGFSQAKWDPDNYLILGGLYSPAPGTMQCKVWQYSIDGITAIKSEKPSAPQNFSLSQNYPNPFNPTTTIDFSIVKAGNVSLKVYDLLGKEVKTLVDQFIQAGNHSIKFDAKNLPSGIYFYQLKEENNSCFKKMLLLK